MARKIESSEIRLDFLKYYQIALETMHLRKSRAYVFLGFNVNPDICVSIADFLMKIQSVTWSIVSAIHENELVIIFRNDGLQKDAGKAVKKAFGKLGSAGGHKAMARAQIPLENLKNVISKGEYKDVLYWIISMLENRTDKKAEISPIKK